jgi:hypothetical protein
MTGWVRGAQDLGTGAVHSNGELYKIHGCTYETHDACLYTQDTKRRGFVCYHSRIIQPPFPLIMCKD